MKHYAHLDELFEAYRSKRSAIRRRLKEYRQIPPDRYFYELIYCLMTPQSSAVHAMHLQQLFESLQFKETDLDPEPLLQRKDSYIRFHKTKSQWIIEMKSRYDMIFNVLVSPISASEKREWLVNNVKGLSYKESTHFLRNIGKNDKLAILDRHILRYLKHHRVIRSLPKTLTRKRYLKIENQFSEFSDSVGILVDELDLLFWSNATGEILK